MHYENPRRANNNNVEEDDDIDNGEKNDEQDDDGHRSLDNTENNSLLKVYLHIRVLHVLRIYTFIRVNRSCLIL